MSAFLHQALKASQSLSLHYNGKIHRCMKSIQEVQGAILALVWIYIVRESTKSIYSH